MRDNHIVYNIASYMRACSGETKMQLVLLIG